MQTQLRLNTFFKILLFIGTLMYQGVVYATVSRTRTVTESFTSSNNLDSTGGMVWNIGRGELHPPLQLEGWNDGSAHAPISYSVGDGQHGDFVESRYQLFDRDSVVTGGIIEIDTDQYQDLQFTSFHLKSGYTLKPVGTKPLLIRSQTTILIEGTISCSGDNGADAVSDPTVSLNGGTGRCGGARGGASVPAGVTPGLGGIYDGAAGSTFVGAGRAGPVQLATGGQGGGGGGAHIKSDTGDPSDKPAPTNGDNSAGGNGGLAGAIYRDDAFQDAPNGSGSGGGGGSGYDNAMDAPAHSSGASGGAGGGVVFLYAVDGVTVSAMGSIKADGGNGGSALAGKKGGAGGGGGGGSILIWSGDDIVFDGPVTAQAGTGGASAGGDGGTGAWGRTWVAEVDGFAGGTVIEDPESRLNVPGQVRFETGASYVVTSGAIEMGNTKPMLINAGATVANQGASTVDLDLAFSADNTLANLTNWADSSTYFNQEVFRYTRFQLTISSNPDGVNPIRIQDVQWVYSGYQQDEYQFVTGCGSVSGIGKITGPGASMFWCIPLLLLIYLRWERRQKLKVRA